MQSTNSNQNMLIVIASAVMLFIGVGIGAVFTASQTVSEDAVERIVSTEVAALQSEMLTESQIADSVATQIAPLQASVAEVSAAALSEQVVRDVVAEEISGAEEAITAALLTDEALRQIVTEVVTAEVDAAEEAITAALLTDEALRQIVTEIVAAEVAALPSPQVALDADAIAPIVAAAVADSERAQRIRADDDPFLGPEDAPVVIVEFSDFLCPFCGRHYQETMPPLLENYDGYVRYVYRDYPGVGGDYAVQSALAAECANEQDAFWGYHDLLFSNQEDLRPATLEALRPVLVGFAADLELDIDAFTECLDSERHLSDIIGDLNDAQAVGARGTPSFLINGQFVSGAQPYEVFANIVEAELANQGIFLDQESGG